MRCAIVAIRYLEPDWNQTKSAIEATGAPVHFVHRSPAGVGNMAEAFNRGFHEVHDRVHHIDYIWFVSNVVFKPDLLPELIRAMDANVDYAALHPCFASDHLFCRPTSNIDHKTSNIAPIPFCEFTAPIVRADVFAKFQLDESMPYWGHDLDWGYRLWQAGHKIGVLQSDRPLLDHTYIRFVADRPVAGGADPGRPATGRPATGRPATGRPATSHPVAGRVEAGGLGNPGSPPPAGDPGSPPPATVTRQRYALRRASNASTRYQLAKKYGENYRDLIFPQSEAEIERWNEKFSHSMD